MKTLYKIVKDSKFCHSIPDRCFTFRNHKLPICSRCLGIFIGGIIAIMLFSFFEFTFNNYLILTLLFISPCIFDSITQELGFRISNNKLRFTTGFLLGWGIMIFINNFI